MKRIGITTSRVFTKIRNANSRIVVNEGSARSTKTYSIIQSLIQKALENKNTRITVGRARSTWLRDSVFIDFKDILANQFYRYNQNNLNKTEMKYRFENGSSFSFIGLDEPQKLHGRKQDITWLNEANECDYDSYRQLSIRTTKQIYLDYNPSMEESWIFEKVLPRPDSTLIHSTYKDNPFLEPEIIAEIESLEPTPENIKNGTADETLWKIYGLGLRASPKGLIFPDFTIVDELPKKEDCKKIFHGMDFGYTNDPTTLLEIRYAFGELWIKELLYKRGLTNIINQKKPQQPSIENELRKRLFHSFPHTIWADSAEPKSIDELRDSGFNVKGVVKGADSINNGIDIVKRFRINIHVSSLNTIKELRNYKWLVDKDGITINKPIDNFNHAMDAIRYGVMSEIKVGNRSFRGASLNKSVYG